jgi:hypothetical protein
VDTAIPVGRKCSKVFGGGYSFQLIDPWPAEWSFDGDCYIDEMDGEYFLFDVLHPGVRIAMFIVE